MQGQLRQWILIAFGVFVVGELTHLLLPEQLVCNPFANRPLSQPQQPRERLIYTV
jgi:hypothetical protein